MNHDSILLKIFFNKENKIIGGKVARLKRKFPNILSYLNKRYHDSFSLKETLIRMKYHIDVHPKCPVCGNFTKFYGSKKLMFANHCSNKCTQLDDETKIKFKQTCFKKYGVDAPMKSSKIKEKSKQTCLEKYGVDNYSKTNEFNDKVKNTCLLKYNRNYCLNIDKSKQTCLEKYGVSSWFKTDDFKTIIKEKQKEIKIKYKQTCLEKYGVEYAAQSQEIKEKIIESKRRNHTFNTSKPEEELYLYIKEKFPLVKRQYKDKIRYPYNCDFYIPELDYFIELQGYYTHNTHPYNPNSISDQVLVERYKEKYGPKCQAITIWTIKDPEKRECAKHNHLNFKEVWDLYEGKEFIDYIYNEFKNINV